MKAPGRVNEIERKFEAPRRVRIPDFTGVICVQRVSEPFTIKLDAIYFDTPDFALARNHVTLRRRSGGDDEGWHVKMPAEEGRTELHWPLHLQPTASGIPARVREALADILGKTQVDPVARIRTRRTVQNLERESGVVAEFVRDEVRATNYWTLADMHWREWEVELKSAAPDGKAWRTRVLNEIQLRLLEAGAVVSTRPSKVGTVLDSTAPRAAGSVVMVALVRLAHELAALIPKAVADKPDAVHQTRVRVRKLRSVLAVYGPLLPRKSATRLRKALRGLGERLAPARDLEVLADRADGEFLAAVDTDTRIQVVGHIKSDRAQAHASLCRLLTSGSVRKLVSSLGAFALEPKAGSLTRAPAAEVLPRLIAPLADEVSGLVASIMRDIATASPDDVHTARKRGRRLRYAVDAVAGLLPEDAVRDALEKLERVGHDLQDAIGEYRDDMIFADRAAGGLHPEIGAELSSDQIARFSGAARERASTRILSLPAELVQLDAARAALATALFDRHVDRSGQAPSSPAPTDTDN